MILYILLSAFFKIQVDVILQLLKTLDRPLGETNTERRTRISAGIKKFQPWGKNFEKIKISQKVKI